MKHPIAGTGRKHQHVSGHGLNAQHKVTSIKRDHVRSAFRIKRYGLAAGMGDPDSVIRTLRRTPVPVSGETIEKIRKGVETFRFMRAVSMAGACHCAASGIWIDGDKKIA